jgi:hypothetical protein
MTPRRSRRNSSSIIVDSPTATEPSPVRTTPSRGQKRDYYTLHHHGFSGPSLPVSDIQIAPPTKRARVNQARKSQAIAIESENEEADLEQDTEEDSQVEKKSGKKVWWWKYFTITILSSTYEKGSSK